MQDIKVQWDVVANASPQAKDGEKWGSRVMVKYVGFDRDFVYFEYDDAIKPYLFDPETYANLDLNIQKRLTLDVAIVLYEWAVRYKNVRRTRVMHWEQWRDVLYADENHSSSMLVYKEFKRRKLIPAIQEVNDLTDLQVELVESRGGARAVQELQFLIREKPRFLVNEEELPQAEIDRAMEDWGLSKIERRNILQRYPAADIQANIETVRKRITKPNAQPIIDVRRYFKVSMERGYYQEQRDTAKPAASALPSTAPQTEQVDPAREVEMRFHQQRNSQAAAMLQEMDESDRLPLLEEYNGESEKMYQVPLDPKGRSNRVMIPFYAWLAARTWGNPSSTELISFALKSSGKVD
jgi:hypothetical protein